MREEGGGEGHPSPGFWTRISMVCLPGPYADGHVDRVPPVRFTGAAATTAAPRMSGRRERIRS